MIESKRKKVDYSSIAPSTATIEVLSNGTTQMASSFLLRTQFRSYIFNCPEGMSRFMNVLRLRPNQVDDIFITKAKWDNVGGISGVLLGKDSTEKNIRIHGPKFIGQFLDTLRPTLDVDIGNANYSAHVDFFDSTRQHYEDSALSIFYLPISSDGSNFSESSTEKDGKFSSNDVAYLIELKNCSPRIDTLKLIQLKIPRSPVIGQLKAGKTVVLDDGRIIKPEDVIDQNNTSVEFPILLVVDVDSDENFLMISNNPMLQNYINGDAKFKQINYIVHFTSEKFIQSKKYKTWMHSFGPNCSHLILNGNGKIIPQNDGIYNSQILLRNIFPEGFPELYPEQKQYEEECFTQDSEQLDVLLMEEQTTKIFEKSKVIYPGTLRRFPMRGCLDKEVIDEIQLDFRKTPIEERIVIAGLSDGINNFKNEISTAETTTQTSPMHPIVTFLGTGSACPSKYRNVSSCLLQLNEQTNLLIDCGEGTYGQMIALLGPEKSKQLLTNLKAIFITHVHLDHILGIFRIIQKRIEAFQELDLPYRPLIIVCERAVTLIIKKFSSLFFDIFPYILLMDMSKSITALISDNKGKPSNTLITPWNWILDLTQLLPCELYSPEEWDLRSVHAVRVMHTKWAAGFIFETHSSRRKIVFSGDTKPCHNLEIHGRNADLLIHECTLEDGMEDDATIKKHSTMRQAFDSAQRMCAKQVIFTHFSARYGRVPPLPDYLLEAGNVSVAMDNMVVPFNLVNIFPKLLPVYRNLFSAELDQIDRKTMNRVLTYMQQHDEK